MKRSFLPSIKKTLSTIFVVVVIGYAIYGLERFCHKQTDGFSVGLIRPSFLSKDSYPFLFNEDISATDISSLLSGTLRYIGRGGQCFAFLTEDGTHVVKFLKYNNNYPKIWFRICPFPFGLETLRQKKIANKQQKLDGEYESYKIALQDLQEETGIVYFHIHTDPLLDQTITIQDKIGSLHSFPADQYQFYIQKKGSPFYPNLEKMLSNGELDTAKKALFELSCYLVKRCQKQITDGDDGIWRNFAFYGDHPFQIDIGQFSYTTALLSKNEQQKDLLWFTEDFRNWLGQMSPSLAQYFFDSLVLLTQEEPCPLSE